MTLDFLSGGPPQVAPVIAALIRDHAAALPTVTYDVLAAYYGSGVDRLVEACEALYAVALTAPPEALVVCAQLARMADENAFHELGKSGRARLIVAAMRRRLGELTAAEAPPADDPPPLAEYLSA